MIFLGGLLPEKLGGGVRPASQNPYLFMTKICDIPYPIYELTKNLKPNLWPDPQILFQTSILISSVVQTNFKLP